MKKARIRITTIRTIIVILAFSILSGGIGFSFGRKNIPLEINTPRGKMSIIDTVPTQNPDVDMSLFWEVWRRLDQNYVDRSKLDNQKMIYGAISGMTAALGDPYTIFLPPDANKEVKESLNGTFEGIGAQLGPKDGRVVVIAPLKGMPAEKAGLKPGDIIIKVGDVDALSLSVAQTVEKIRGPKGTKIALTVLHEGEDQPVTVEITRDTIQVPSVESEIKAQMVKPGETTPADPHADVAILKLYQFGDNTSEEWEKEVTKIIQKCGVRIENCKGIVFDLRNNPGG
ncbi:MAG: PDZ domain-containing protein, partial [Candidatus Paceibacterota bacterium]